MYYYNTSWVKKQSFFTSKEPSREKVMSTYISHYRNRCLLDRLLISMRGDMRGTYKVEQEILVCDRKLDYWSRHRLFSYDNETLRKLKEIKVACLNVNF